MNIYIGWREEEKWSTNCSQKSKNSMGDVNGPICEEHLLPMSEQLGMQFVACTEVLKEICKIGQSFLKKFKYT